MTSLQQWTVELVGPKGYIHGWIRVGADVEHKDSSKGTVRQYDPNTQTAHVDWMSGPRSKIKGGSGTTKAYHLKRDSSGALVKPEPKPASLIPPKPGGMSEKRYRELYDSEPHYVEGPGFRYRVAGPVSAQVVADTYRRKGIEATIRPAHDSTTELEPPLAKPAPVGDQKSKQGVGGTRRKHDWAQVGTAVRHKDGSTGTIRAYESATQTAHVEWEKGPRSQKGGVQTFLGRMGTTKAYHITKVTDTAPKLTGREKALYGTKFPDSAPKPKVEIKRPADPFSGIPGAHAEPDHAERVRDLGLEPITGTETHTHLVDKLTAHYRMIQARPKMGSGTINAHHTAMGIPQVTAHQDLPAMQKATVAAYVAEVHRRAPKGTAMPQVSIENTSGLKGSNDLATSVAAYYNADQHKIGVGQQYVVGVKHNTPGGLEQRGFFSRSGHASFLQRSITHEYGHSRAMSLGQVKESKMLTEVSHALPGATPLQPMTSMRQWVKDNKAMIINKVGTYASADERELAAELYTEFVHAAAPSPAAQVVGKYLEGRA